MSQIGDPTGDCLGKNSWLRGRRMLLTELPFGDMTWSNQLHVLIPLRVILALAPEAPVVTESGAFFDEANLF